MDFRLFKNENTEKCLIAFHDRWSSEKFEILSYFRWEGPTRRNGTHKKEKATFEALCTFAKSYQLICFVRKSVSQSYVGCPTTKYIHFQINLVKTVMIFLLWRLIIPIHIVKFILSRSLFQCISFKFLKCIWITTFYLSQSFRSQETTTFWKSFKNPALDHRPPVIRYFCL